MGLLDSILGQVTGQSTTSAGSGGGGTASMLLPALMAIMAAKSGGGGGLGGLVGGAGGIASGQGGGLGGMLGSLMGGASSPAQGQGSSGVSSLGSILGGGGIAGGIGQLVQAFEQSGSGGAAQSWVGNGANKGVSPDQVGQALGSDTIDQLANHTGMSQGTVMSELSQLPPQAVHQLTPSGRLPTADEAGQWV